MKTYIKPDIVCAKYEIYENIAAGLSEWLDKPVNSELTTAVITNYCVQS